MEIKDFWPPWHDPLFSTSSYATYGYWSNNHNCGGGYILSGQRRMHRDVDFTNNPSDLCWAT